MCDGRTNQGFKTQEEKKVGFSWERNFLLLSFYFEHIYFDKSHILDHLEAQGNFEGCFKICKKLKKVKNGHFGHKK